MLRFLSLLTAVAMLSTPVAPAVLAETAPDPGRVAAVAELLSEAPRGVGRPIGDRKSWQEVAEADGYGEIVADAERLMSEPIPELTDDLFLDYSRTGNRSRCQKVLSKRHSRVTSLVLAECVENRGRFLPAVEEAIRAVSSEKTWVLPAHDHGLRNFRGETVEIDLAVAGFSWELATAAYWLGDKLSEDVRLLIRDELERRTFAPFLKMVNEGKPRMWWLTGTNNWNAVCLAGVTGAAMAAIEPPHERAVFVAAAEKYIEHFLSGFTPDGYCSEGVGYWNYGFGNYVLLAETICQATGGKIDWLDDPAVERIARFGPRMEILPGVYPAFADCRVGSEPDERLVAFLSRRYGWGLHDVERQGLGLAPGPTGSLVRLGLYGFPNSATSRAAAEKEAAPPLRDWFADAGILIARPAPGRETALGAALKGGHNAEHHNHNDVGSYVVALGGSTPLADPGSEVYTARTFSGRRYESNVLNSFGHPVPMVAGKLQRPGRSAAGEVLQADFTDETDTLVLDLRSAYPVEGLNRLRRTFVFSRDGRGSLVVKDEAAFEQPREFGTAMVTFERWRQTAPDRLIVGRGDTAVEVRVDTAGRDFRVSAQRIEEDLGGRGVPTRLGIDLTEPTREAEITITVVPSG